MSDVNANQPGRQTLGTAGQGNRNAAGTAPDQASANAKNSRQLPATGSELPMMLLGAFSAFAAAGGLRIARR